MKSSNQFDASGSLAGYIFQCRLALLLGLQAVKRKPNGQISIEKFDDIAFDNDDHANCMIQAKHHISAKDLTDSSVDVWKTLRIWVQDFKEWFESAIVAEWRGDEALVPYDWPEKTA